MKNWAYPFFLFLLLATCTFGETSFAEPKIQVTQSLSQSSIREGLELKGSLKVENRGTGTLKILGVKPSCGCTTIKIPKRKLGPGESTIIPFVVDTRGKVGKVKKNIKIYSNSTGPAHIEPIAFHVLPKMKEGETNLDFILEPPCASCHIDPAVGKKGSELFEAICKICHATTLRSKSQKGLKEIITRGLPKEGMPAFGDDLSERQINSLVGAIINGPPKQ